MGDNVEAAKVLAIGKQDDYTYAARAAYLARAKRRKTPRAIEVAASVEPPASVAAHAAIGREAAGRSGSVLVGGPR